MATYAFGPYLLGERDRTLTCHGRYVALQPKTVQVLAQLIRRAPGVLTKEELLETLWGDDDVSEGNLTQQIFLLRRVFAHHTPDQTYIVTEQRRGYRFVANVREVSTTPPRRGAAWDLDIRGRFFADQRRRLALHEALRTFEQAVAVDPHFAPGYAGIADCHALLAEYLYATPQEAFARARSAAGKALALDSSLAEAHATLGEVAFYHDFDETAALKHYELATRLDPALVSARIYKAWFFATAGAHERAEAELDVALRTEPYSLKVLTSQAAVRIFARDFEFAERRCRDVLEMDPSYVLARHYLAGTLAYSGRAEAALEQLATRSESEYEQQFLALYGFVAARAGLKSIADDVLQALETMAGWAYVSSFSVAQVLFGLGRSDEARRCLEEGRTQRDPWTVLARAHPAFEGLS